MDPARSTPRQHFARHGAPSPWHVPFSFASPHAPKAFGGCEGKITLTQFGSQRNFDNKIKRLLWRREWAGKKYVVSAACKPNSVCLKRPMQAFRLAAFTRGRRPFLWARRCRRARCGLPADHHATSDACRASRAGTVCLFGLAAGGVCLAANVTTRAVRSYRTISPLPGEMLNAE